MRAFLAGFRLELRVIRASPDAFIPLVTAPIFGLIFLSIVRQSGRPDLQADALLATPSSLASVLLGRISALTAFGLISFVEVWAFGKLVYGVSIPFEHPGALGLTLLATAFATAGTSVAFAAVFVLTRNAYTFTNSLSYPLYVLGGVFVPVAFLPGLLKGIAAFVFMSWSADLLRASLKPPPIDDLWLRLGIVVLLGTIGLLVGRALLFHVLRRMRANGELSTA